MDAVLVIIGVLGFIAIAIAAYVFTVAARTYVSSEHSDRPTHDFIQRSPIDRRRGNPVTFPFMLQGEIIASERRVQPDRRQAPQQTQFVG